MEHCKNYFIKSLDAVKSVSITATSIAGTFSNTYVVGQYVLLKNTQLNDGVYKVIGYSDGELFLDTTLQSEEVEDVLIFALAVPRDFIKLVDIIEAFTLQTVGKENVSSESIAGLYSVSYNSSDTGSNSWQSVYKSSLRPYKKLFYNWGKGA